MYYKITNKESEVYKKLHEMRSNEIQFESDNIKAIQEKIGNLEWSGYLGISGQQNFGRVTHYSGFNFKDPSKVNLKTWKIDKDNPSIFIPNLRTKSGREMSQFLSNGLKRSSYSKVCNILNIARLGRFTFPFVEICSDVIILYLDEKHRPSDENIIEITSKEFEELRSAS